MTISYIIKNNKNLILNLFFLAAIIVIFPRCFTYQIPDESVDSGWIWAIRYFVENSKHYTWGRDVIYTYGPLGVFSIRNFSSSLWFLQLLLDAYIILQLYLSFAIFKENYSFKKVLIFIACTSTFLWEINVITQFFNIVFLSILAKNKNKNWLSYLIIFNISILTFIKVNTILTSIFSLIILIVILLKTRSYINVLVNLFILVTLQYSIIYLFNVSFFDYISFSFEIVKYYSHSMYFFSNAYNSTFFISLLFISAFLFVALKNSIYFINKKNYINFLLLLHIVLAVFFFFKQGFTRADRFHFTQFFSFFPILLYILGTIIKKNKSLISITIILSIGFSYFLTLIVFIKGYSFCTDCVFKVPIFNYFIGLKNKIKEKENQFVNHTNSYKSVDFLYNNCFSKSKFTEFKWNNRPAFQSIINSSSMIDSINAKHYKNANAPSIIIYKADAIDNRNFLWDEPQTFWTFLKNYELKEKIDSNQLLFVKKNIISNINSQQIIDTNLSLNSTFDLPINSQGLYSIKLNITENLLGKIRATIFQPAPINVKLNLNTGTSISYRYIYPLHNNQHLIINKAFEKNNIDSLHKFFSDLNFTQTNIKSIELSTNQTTCFNSTVKLQLFKNILKSN